MTFESLAFVLFLAIAATAFWLVPARFKGHALLAASYAFYATWSLTYAALLIVLTVMVYAAALRIERCSVGAVKRRVMWATVVALLGVMALFKYFNDISPFVGGRLSALHVIAPLGLSYYTFKLVGYVLDVYWERIPAEQSLLAVANYAAFFPQMVCGPIQRAEDFFAQTSPYANPSVDAASSGLRLILFGLFKKLVVADQLGMVIDPWFTDLRHQAPAQLLLILYLYPIQLYADFSGITDIAIGIGRFFGVESPPNFDGPFYAPNISDFWRRWHMSLSSWLRDYLFMPVRYATRALGHVGLVFSLMVTMLAIGVWHGALSSYFVFGLINGVYMSTSALTLTRRNRWFKAHRSLAAARQYAGPLLLFHLVLVALIFFRAPTPSAATFALAHGVPAYFQPRALVAVVSAFRLRLGIAMLGAVVMEVGHLARRRPEITTWFSEQPVWIRWSAYYGVGLVIVLLGVFTRQTFIYQQF
jgi:D-alanyl-lipoteichoic acid acyltransferase DltB (MBOAT superfamily)